MIRYRQGDLLSADAQALVNPVNCVGTMGRGLALQFKCAYPDNTTAYQKAVRAGRLRIGRVHVFETGRLGNPQYIVNFPTKRDWRDASRVGDIALGLLDLAEVVRKHEVQSLAVPALGCGLGGLDWKQVKPLVEKALGCLKADIWLFEPM